VRYFSRLLFVFGLLFFSGCASWSPVGPLAQLENNLIFQPTPFPADFPLGEVPFENVEFYSSDGTKLHGWFLDHPNAKGVALICHGNGGNIASRGESLLVLHRRHQLAVMIFDYRGYGQSEGTPSESGVFADARAARKWLAKRKNIGEQDVVWMGRSLGGAVAVDLAAKDCAKGLVLASTFTSLPAVAAELMPALPAKWLMRQRFDSLEKIRDYHGPLLQTHGDADKLIPIELGKKLFDAAPGPKTFVTIPDAGHNDPPSQEYRQKLDLFLDGLNKK